MCYNKKVIKFFMTSKELIRLLKREGWYKVKQEGSHLKLRKDGFQDVIIPVHNKNLPKGLLFKILKETKMD